MAVLSKGSRCGHRPKAQAVIAGLPCRSAAQLRSTLSQQSHGLRSTNVLSGDGKARLEALARQMSEHMTTGPLTDRPITIVIPVFNEAEGLDELRLRLPAVLDRATARWQVLFVDDGSSDDTLTKIRAISASDPRFAAISLSRNFGKEIAIAAGLRYVTGDAAIIMDADLQHPPEVVLAFVERWLEGYTIVYGQRIDRRLESRAALAWLSCRSGPPQRLLFQYQAGGR